MGKAIDYVEKRLREVERQDILKAQLKVKFGDISDNLYEQINRIKPLESHGVLFSNLFVSFTR